MLDLGVTELLIIAFIVILIVCAPRLPRGPFSNGPFSN
jgi:Sec-independent protein translocase protein TatA